MPNNVSEGALVATEQSSASGAEDAPKLLGLGTAVRGAEDGLVVDALAHEVVLHGQHVSMTAREFALLRYLYEHRGVVFTREQLLRDVWGQSYRGGPRTVDIHIRRLRIKLGSEWLETIRQVGYKFRRRG
jgi:DNA-binding response OmpR family regulator